MEKSNSAFIFDNCCADVNMYSPTYDYTHKQKVCMKKQTVKYNYGVTVEGGHNVDLKCSFASMLSFTYVVTIGSFLIMAFD